jgi:biopolymer transport protein ExbD
VGRSLFVSRKKKRTPRIEIIPMVDVMFLLLVFYILSTIAMTTERGIPVSLPAAASGQTVAAEEIVVSINAQGEVYLNQKRVELPELGAAMRALAEELPGGLAHLRQGYVVLNVDMAVPHRSVVSAMDQLNLLGITNFSIATEEGAE